jgi:hypothetical protein
MTELPEKDNDESDRLRTFVSWLNTLKNYPAPIQIIRYVEQTLLLTKVVFKTSCFTLETVKLLAGSLAKLLNKSCLTKVAFLQKVLNKSCLTKVVFKYIALQKSLNKGCF